MLYEFILGIVITNTKYLNSVHKVLKRDIIMLLNCSLSHWGLSHDTKSKPATTIPLSTNNYCILFP